MFPCGCASPCLRSHVDEPGTSACAGERPNTGFWCNVDEKTIFSSQVHDGIADCCDASDEWQSQVSAQLPRASGMAPLGVAAHGPAPFSPCRWKASPFLTTAQLCDNKRRPGRKCGNAVRRWSACCDNLQAPCAYSPHTHSHRNMASRICTGGSKFNEYVERGREARSKLAEGDGDSPPWGLDQFFPLADRCMSYSKGEYTYKVRHRLGRKLERERFLAPLRHPESKTSWKPIKLLGFPSSSHFRCASFGARFRSRMTGQRRLCLAKNLNGSTGASAVFLR